MISNLLLTRDLSVVDDRICPPPTMQPADLGDLLAIVAERMAPEGVLMLSGPWADYVRPVQEAGGPQGEPAPHAAGDWRARVVQGDTWIRWTSSDHSLWTCEVDAIPPGEKNSPLIADDPVVTAAQFHTWRELTGVPWVGTPGMAGNALLVDGWRKMNPKASEPYWSKSGIWYPTEERPDWPFGEIEQPYTTGKWSRDYSGPMHGYDLNKAYLSAYQVVSLPLDSLTHHTVARGADAFRPDEPAIWRVTLSPWRYEHLLPDPAGYANPLEDGTRWLTTQTLALLRELTERGDYGGFQVHEFWGLAEGRRVTRKWAELLRDVAGAARAPFGYAAKQVYKQTYGMWARPGGRVARPDWRAMIIAQSRVNLWRKMDAAARNAPTLAASPSVLEEWQRFPVRVETDCVFYASVTDWERDAPHNFKLDASGLKLGHFKPYEPKGSR